MFRPLAVFLVTCHGWWFEPNRTEPLEPPTWWERTAESMPRWTGFEDWRSWGTERWELAKDTARGWDPTKWECGLWMFIDTIVSFGGWLVFGSSWSGVPTGCRMGCLLPCGVYPGWLGHGRDLSAATHIACSGYRVLSCSEAGWTGA